MAESRSKDKVTDTWPTDQSTNAKMGSGDTDLLGTEPSDSPVTRKASTSQEKDRLTGAVAGGTHSRPCQGSGGL